MSSNLGRKPDAVDCASSQGSAYPSELGGSPCDDQAVTYRYSDALNISVDDLVKPALECLASSGTAAPDPPLPLTADAWRTVLEVGKQDAESRAERYPPGFVLDDSRELRSRDSWSVFGFEPRVN